MYTSYVNWLIATRHSSAVTQLPKRPLTIKVIIVVASGRDFESVRDFSKAKICELMSPKSVKPMSSPVCLSYRQDFP